jgi:alanyl-tRNA synthetase
MGSPRNNNLFFHALLLPRALRFPHFSATAATPRFFSQHFANNMASSQETRSQWTAERVRSRFIDYFKEREHTFGESDPSPPQSPLLNESDALAMEKKGTPKTVNTIYINHRAFD